MNQTIDFEPMNSAAFSRFVTLALIGLFFAFVTGHENCLADEKKVTKSVSKTATSTSSVNISVETNNDEATVKYDGKEVWKGKVKKPVITVAKSIDGKDLAAAFEGRKLLWENVAGAGAKLEEERKKAAKRLKNL